jgi:predicted secreted protein
MAQGGMRDLSLDQPKIIELHVGESYEISFPGHGTAGYVWGFKMESETRKIAEVEEKQNRAKDSKSIKQRTYSADRTFAIHAISPGNARVRFMESRPWEKDKQPLNEHNIEIFVRA